jgi:hypothetical protein
MERTMEQTSTNSVNDGTATRELQDDQLDNATGGLVVNSVIAVLIGQLLPEKSVLTRGTCKR